MVRQDPKLGSDVGSPHVDGALLVIVENRISHKDGRNQANDEQDQEKTRLQAPKDFNFPQSLFKQNNIPHPT